jgi:hypothetical protein
MLKKCVEILVINPEGKRPLGDNIRKGRVILKRVLNSDSEFGPVPL